MDRNNRGEATRRASPATTMVTSSNGLPRRRHRTNSLRDSPEDDVAMELIQEPSSRLRDRGGLKKDRDHRDRDRSSSRTKRQRRAERLIHGSSNNREDVGGGGGGGGGLGEDSSEESVNDEEDEEEEDGCGGGSYRMLPPNPVSNNHLSQHRKSYPPTPSDKVVFRPSVPVWKPGDEMIGVSIPRKARSASTKRGGGGGGGGGVEMVGGFEQIQRQASSSPVRQSVISTLTAAPMSPSSSNASVRKKMKANNGLKPRPPPPKSSSKSTSSSNPEELEFEIAEVLYGLRTQSSSSKKEVESNETRETNNTNNKSTSDAKSSGVSSPISNSPSIWPPLNSNGSSAAPLSAVAPKRKRPRQVVENMVVGSFEVRGSSTIITTKVEMDHQPPKTENSSPKNPGSVAENGGCAYDLGNLVNSQGLVPTSSYSEPEEVKPLMIEEAAAGGSPKKESAAVVRLLEDNMKSEDVTKTATTNLNSACSEMKMEKPKEEKFHIDLMAPPPQLRSSPEREDKVDFALTKAAVEDKPMVSNVDVEMVAKEEDKKGGKIGKDEAVNVAMEEERKAKSITDHAESQKPIENNKGRNIDLQLDLEKPDRESASNKLQNQVQKQQQQQQQPPAKATRETASHPERTVQSSSLPLPMSMASWPGGLPPMGYMAPLQGVVSMDGSAMPSAPMQPLFSQPRPKRCETHCYIARNIHYLQQCMKVNPFWSAAGGTASLFGAKPGSLNVMPSADLNGNIAGRGMNPVQDKGQSLGIFPGMTSKDKVPQAANIVDATQRKQQILLQQALPPVAPNNILHGPAFIFPLNHQQAAVAATAATRPGFAKSHTTAGTPSHASSSATVNSSATAVGAGAATAMSFTYPTLPANEAQYLAILQNNAYPFPIPAVGAPPNYRGSHAQAMPLYNGSFYSSQMIHPSQLQQQQAPPSQSHQVQHANHNTSISSSSSSSHKHLQSQQQKPQVGAVNGGSGGGNLQNYPAAKNRLSQPQQQQQQNQHLSSSQQSRQLEVEVGGEDSPSAVDSRLSRATMSVHGQNFAMPIHTQNFALMTPPAALATTASGSGNPNEKKQQQQPQQLGLKGGVDSLPPQTFAMSFTTINGPTTTPGIDISSMAQNHAILQSLPDATTRQNYQMMTVAAATQVAAHQQQKNYRIGEDGKTGVSDSSNADEERKALGSKTATTGGQSIAFSRDLTGGSGPARTSSPIPHAVGSLNASSSQLAKALQAQQQQQQMIQLQKRQQQHQHQQQQQHQHQQQQFAAAVAARSKTPATSNGSVYSEHATSVSSVPAKFSNSLSAFPQNLVQSSNGNSPAQSPQWKNSGRPTNSQAPSSLVSTTTSSLKNLPQQQARGVQQSNMQISQISFSANQKSSAVLHGQQTAGNNHQSTSPPMVGGSPTTSSISKGASGSPRTTSASTSNKAGQASALSSQQAKKSPSASSQKSSPVGGRNVPSILGNHHITSSPSSGAKSQIMQQQQLPTNIQQGQLFFSNPFMQAQSPHSTSTGSNVSGSGFYLQRRHSEQQKQPQQPPASSAASSSGMLLISTSTTDTAKGITAAAASNMKGGSLTSQGILQAAQFAAQSQGNPHQLLPAGFSYVHAVPTAVQVKQAEQKQPAGNVNLHACWQPEKK